MLGPMLIETAEKFYGGKRAGVARVLNEWWSQSAVYLWKDVVPLAAARKLSELSGGRLEVIDSMYDQHGNIVRSKDQSAA
jgi:hypothetical protein